MKNLYVLFGFVFCIFSVNNTSLYAQLNGTYAIPGDYATISAAVTALNTSGISGTVTFNVAANYTENITVPILLIATGTSSNNITFQKSGTGANPLVTRTDAGTLATSALGGQGDAIIIIQGSDYVTFDGISVTANNQGIEYGYYLRKTSTTDGCKNVTIKNAVITMTKGTSGYVVGIYSSNNDASSPVSAAGGITVASTGGRHENVTITGNTISNVHAGILLRGYNHTVSPYDFQDQNFVVGQSGAGNTILNYAGGSASAAYGIYLIYHTGPTISYNTINNAGGGGTDATSTLYGIFSSVCNALGNFICNNNAITLGQGSTSLANCIHIANPTTSNSITVNNNTFGYGTFASTTTSYFIYASTLTNNVTVTGNNTSGTINKTGVGQLEGYSNIIGTATGGTANISGNNFSNITLTGASTFYGIRQSTSTAQVVNINSNTISNITADASNAYGIYQGGGAAGSTISGNNIYNITGSSVVNGIYCGAVAASITLNASNNNIYGLSSTGVAIVYGIYTGLGNVNSFFQNRIYNLSNSNSGGIVYGITVAGGTTNYLYNNYVSDLKTPNGSAIDPIRGIYVSGGTTIGLYYNTIYLNASSSGAIFGSSGVYASTTPTLEMRNNIIVNATTPKGGGSAVAFRRSNATLTTYSANSNNNCFYAGIPGPNNLIHFNGTTGYQTISDFKTLVAPRDAASFTENPPFMNVSTPPYDLHLNNSISTLCESGGAPVSSPIAISDDYDGNTRNASAPDVGADEIDGFTDLQWTGTSSTDWNTTGNWNPARVPLFSSNVTIPSAPVNQPIISGAMNCKNLNINTSASLTISGSNSLTVYGNWNNCGTFSPNTGAVIFGGTTLQTISAETFNNLTINNSNGVTLSNNVSVNGALTLTAGVLNTDANTLTVNSISGSGFDATKMINLDNGTNQGTLRLKTPANSTDYLFPIGDSRNSLNKYSPVTLNFSTGLNSSSYISAKLYGTFHPNNSSVSPILNRYWDLTPTGLEVSFSYDIVLQYLDGDVTGIEGDLVFGKYNSSWVLLTGNLNTSLNTFTTTQPLTSFSSFTGGQNIAMPVKLSSFYSAINGRDVKLCWISSSEQNNSGFDVERKAVDGNWIKIGFVKGNGTRNTQTNYSYTDCKLNSGKYNYRLKQIDVNGNFSYHNLASPVDVSLPVKFSISQNYPNPFNPATMIDFDLPFDSKVTIILYDITGKKVKTLINETRNAGFHTIRFNASGLSSGVYFYKIQAGGPDGSEQVFIKTNRMILLK